MADPTTYIVLRLTNTDATVTPQWADEAKVQARSAEAAIRESLAGGGAVGGTYVAVPARSWKPVTVKAETTTILKIDPT